MGASEGHDISISLALNVEVARRVEGAERAERRVHGGCGGLTCPFGREPLRLYGFQSDAAIPEAGLDWRGREEPRSEGRGRLMMLAGCHAR